MKQKKIEEWKIWKWCNNNKSILTENALILYKYVFYCICIFNLYLIGTGSVCNAAKIVWCPHQHRVS